MRCWILLVPVLLVSASALAQVVPTPTPTPRPDIVAFRVVERDASGNVTVVWKLLKDVEAPKLNVKK